MKIRLGWFLVVVLLASLGVASLFNQTGYRFFLSGLAELKLLMGLSPQKPEKAPPQFVVSMIDPKPDPRDGKIHRYFYVFPSVEKLFKAVYPGFLIIGIRELDLAAEGGRENHVVIVEYRPGWDSSASRRWMCLTFQKSSSDFWFLVRREDQDQPFDLQPPTQPFPKKPELPTRGTRAFL